MSALIVPMSLVRHAIQQSERLGRDETRTDVVDRVINDLRTTDHPAARAVRDAFARRAATENGHAPAR